MSEENMKSRKQEDITNFKYNKTALRKEKLQSANVAWY